jgi:hypothetical protein
MRARALFWIGASLTASIATAVLIGQSSPPRPLRGDLLPVPAPSCGTEALWELNGRWRADALPNGLADGEPLSFDQDPPLLLASSSNAIAFRNFSVVGDFPSVTFVRVTREAPDGVAENWERRSTRMVSGQIVSVFEPSWGASAIDQAFAARRYGFDQPFVYWGAFQVPGGSTQRYVYARTGIAGIPESPVHRINDQVQYASNVVNLVVPTFDDARITGGMNGFDLVSASRLFYQYFSDAYDVLALTPASSAMGDFSAFHLNVQNAVTGLNISTFNQASRYGSAGALQGIEVYADSFATRYQDTEHEMAHQWGSHFDWTNIAGISRAGHQPAAHAPLWTGGETLVGAVLYGDRRVTKSTGSFTIEQTPPPATYHALERYSMGILTADQVPDFEVFVSQDQFNATTVTSPAIGTALQGDTRVVRIADVIRIHGPRIGPAQTTWRRATVLISRDRLASQREMDYWNFFAERLADRSGSGRPTYANFVPYSRATNNGVTLQTAVTPLNQPALDQRLDTDTPMFGPSDWRGVTFSTQLPSRMTANQTINVSGHVTASDRTDFSQVILGFWKVNAADSVDFNTTVSRSGDFSVPIRFSDSQRGAYYLSIYLFWPGSGSQYPRASVSTVTVE